MEIGAVKGGGYKFVIQADALDLTGTANPIDFEMRLGDQYGLASSKLLGTLSVDSGKQ